MSQEAAHRALTGVDRYSIDFRIIDAEGCLRWVHQQGHVQRDETGRALRFNGVTFDITGEKCSVQDASLH